MKGTIYKINARNGFVAVKTEGGFTIIELLGSDPIDLEDEVSWQVHGDPPLGGAQLINHTQREAYTVYFQNHHVSERGLSAQLGC